MRQHRLACAVVGFWMLASARIIEATVQVQDRIDFDVQDGWLRERPLESIWSDRSQRPRFDERSTAERIGYAAVWAIRDGKLFLTSFEAKVDGKPVAIDRFVPGAVLPLHAKWYTGPLHFGTGPVVGGIPFELRYARSYSVNVRNGEIVGRGVMISNDGKLKNVHLVEDEKTVPLTRFRNPHHIYAAELSPSEKHVFVWHMDFSPRRLKVYDTATRDIVADFVPGVAGELEWSADDRIIHLFGFGTGHYSCLYKTDGTEIRYGTEGRFQFDLHERAVPHVHSSRLAIVYVPCYELAPGQLILVRTSDGELLRLGPKRMIARRWDIKEDRIEVTYSLSTDEAAPTYRGEYRIPEDWLRPLTR